MAEILGWHTQCADIFISIYYEDTNGRPTRVVCDNGGTKTAVEWEIRTADGKGFQRVSNVPTGHSEYTVPPGVARRFDFRTDEEGNALTPDAYPIIGVWATG